MDKKMSDAIERVSADRLLKTTMELVKIPSDPGEETEIAEAYAAYFDEIGFDVQIDREYPESPSVIARYRNAEGPVLQLEGHLDAVPTKHDPPKFEDGRIYGRGSADMKSGLAAMLETCRIIKDSDVMCNLLVTAHGQHEGAGKDNVLHAPLFGLFKRGIFGDAVLIAEGPDDFVNIRNKGLCIFKFIITREGIPTHEHGPEKAPNPIDAAYEIMRFYEEKKREWAKNVDPELGTESFFLGSIVAGELYNTIPNLCTMYGTRRNLPGNPYEEIEKELRGIAAKVSGDVGTDIDVQLWRSGQPYEISGNERIVVSLRKAYQEVEGKPLPIKCWQKVGNTSQFVNKAGVPAVFHGIQNETAHADIEWVELKNIVRATKVYIATVINFYLVDAGNDE